MDVPVSIFDSIKIPTILYILIVFVSVIVLLGIGLGIFWVYHNGSAMHKFFWGRINSWFNKGYSIFQIITLNDEILIEDANYDSMKGYERIIPTIKQTSHLNKKKFTTQFIILLLLIISLYILMIYFRINETIPSLLSIPPIIFSIIILILYFKRETKIINLDNGRKQMPIIPTSSYSLNGIDTVMLWDIHPPLPDYIHEGLNSLLKKEPSIKTLTQFNELVKTTPNEILFRNYTNIEFQKIYLAFKNKYEVNIKVPTIYNFISKNFDENYSESIQIKEYNSAYKTKNSSGMEKWGYIIIGFMVLAIAFKIVWITTHQ